MSGVGVGLLLHFSAKEQVGQVVYLYFLVSNNEAEYEGILVGLDLALALATTKV